MPSDLGPPSTPAWVKAIAIVVAVLVLLVVVGALAGVHTPPPIH